VRKLADLSSDSTSRTADKDLEISCITGAHVARRHLTPPKHRDKEGFKIKERDKIIITSMSSPAGAFPDPELGMQHEAPRTAGRSTSSGAAQGTRPELIQAIGVTATNPPPAAAEKQGNWVLVYAGLTFIIILAICILGLVAVSHYFQQIYFSKK
jgi:hypothetical protein